MQVLEWQPSTGQAQFVPAMYMPHIEGPKIDWTVNEGSYQRFMKWKLSKKYKKGMLWSSDFGMDQYVHWCLPPAELNLETIWSKYEDFCKAQANEV